MVPKGHPSEVYRSDPIQRRLLNKDTHHYSNISHSSGQSMSQSSISQDTAYSYQSRSATHNYPQQLDCEVDSGHTSKKPSGLQQYNEVPRAWASVNSQVYMATNAAELNHEHNARSNQTYQMYSNRFASMCVEKRRPTQSKLGVHNYTMPRTSSMARWEEQTYRTGPWDGVGFVKNDEQKE